MSLAIKETYSQNVAFLQIFVDLANPDPVIHKKAAVTLIRSVDICQKKHEQDGKKDYCSELTYSLQRCVDGLKKTTRPGFFVALGQVSFLDLLLYV